MTVVARGRSILPGVVIAAPRGRAGPREAHVAEHPLIAHYLRAGDHGAPTIGAFASQRHFRQAVLRVDHCRPHPLDRVLLTVLELTGPSVVAIGLHRKGLDYEARERTLLELARPHLELARRNALAVGRLHRQAGRRAAPEILALGADGGINCGSARALALLASYVGPVTPGTIPADLERWLAAVPAASENAPAVPLPFVCDGPNGRLAIHVIDGPDTRYLLLEEERGCAVDALVAAGLTARERDVVGLLTHGKTNAEIGTALGISERTIDKHLEHVLDKLGLENRTAVAAFALEAAG